MKNLGYRNIVKMLLMHGADINAKANNNQTAILIAIENGIKTFKFSLSSFVKKNIFESYTPGQSDVVDELLRNEADTSIPDDNEKTLLDLAKEQSNYLKQKKPIQMRIIFYSFI